MSVTEDQRCNTPVHVGDLHVERILPNLTAPQLTYATYLALAGWAGLPLIQAQSSSSARSICNFLVAFLTKFPRAELEASLTDPNSPILFLLEYAAIFFTNSSDYLSLGDKKFIPRVPKSDLLTLVSKYPEIVEPLNACVDDLYRGDAGILTFGWPPHGCTAYYHPADFTHEEQEGVDALLHAQNILRENTIIFRHSDRYEVAKMCVDVDKTGVQVGTFKDLPVFVTKGLYSTEIAKMIHWLSLARDNSLNPKQNEMLTVLIAHWEHGEVADHIKYSELWVADVDPPIESHHGFIESYRDPSGVRCEYECFVAAVNPDESKFLHELVNASDRILPLMPYPKEYERSNFNPPSYNAINLLTIVTSFMPQGINIPNYDAVRLTFGFKNVSLTNVVAALAETGDNSAFIADDVREVYRRLFVPTRALNISLHELFGHGSGTQLREQDVTSQNVPDLLNPGEVVKTFYGENDTWQSLFGEIAGSFEECRAEVTALHLALTDAVLDMYCVEAGERGHFRECFVLNMLAQGIATLSLFHRESGQWKQAHAQARFGILRALLNWGKGGIAVKHENGRITLSLDPGKLDAIAEAIAQLLKHLNYYKATAKVAEAKKFYADLTVLDDFWLAVRETSANFYTPRPALCGAVIRKTGTGYTLERFADRKATVLDACLTAVENIQLSTA
jgi:dipeptidyl-peptidase-3